MVIIGLLFYALGRPTRRQGVPQAPPEATVEALQVAPQE
jgi:hypothetical protein